ncbi:MAG: endonuclease III domain-containing protein [Planctomycetota bacterium]
MPEDSGDDILREMYERLWSAYGPQHWWPAQTPTEVVVGAILTQNTAWRNVERAVCNLKAADALTWAALRDLSQRRLAGLIRPAGTYRTKAARLKAFVTVLWQQCGGSLEALLAGEVDDVRRRLLAIRGIGPETADAILLYAGHRPAFVVDAYTKRILRRHHLIGGRATYDAVRSLFQGALAPEPRVYNEYHALLVAVGKKHCRTRARCAGCPLEPLPHGADL